MSLFPRKFGHTWDYISQICYRKRSYIALQDQFARSRLSLSDRVVVETPFLDSFTETGWLVECHQRCTRLSGFSCFVWLLRYGRLFTRRNALKSDNWCKFCSAMSEKVASEENYKDFRDNLVDGNHCDRKKTQKCCDFNLYKFLVCNLNNNSVMFRRRHQSYRGKISRKTPWNFEWKKQTSSPWFPLGCRRSSSAIEAPSRECREIHRFAASWP